MGHVEVNGVGVVLPDGRPLLHDVSFRVGDGVKAALIGANGTGKSTLLRIVAGDDEPEEGGVARSGGLGVMRQFVGSVRDDSTVRDLLVSVAPPGVRSAAAEVDAAELEMRERDDEPAQSRDASEAESSERSEGESDRAARRLASQFRYAQALADWADAGGYDAEVLWDTCTVAALGVPYDQAQWRAVRTLSGGEQKRLVLEALLRGPDAVLLLDEPDNYLDVPGKEWLEQALRDTPKTVLFVSHDRALLRRTATRIVTVEGRTAWTHGGGFAGYSQARQDRHDRMAELRRRWEEEHTRLRELVRTLQQQAANSPDMASRYRAMQTRLARFEAVGAPEAPPVPQRLRMRLGGSRTGVRAVECAGLELSGLMRPFDLEVYFGDRVAVLGSNGSGKSHFLRLLAGDDVAHTGTWKLGARVVPGHFAQTHDHPELAGRTLVDILWTERSRQRGPAMAALRRYELHEQGDQTFDSLSGGQQARFQVLMLELAGTTLLLLDEPTDNLDLASAEALEEALGAYDGTVVAVTHDREFARSFDRYLVFGADGDVYEAPEPVWTEARVRRTR